MKYRIIEHKSYGKTLYYIQKQWIFGLWRYERTYKGDKEIFWTLENAQGWLIARCKADILKQSPETIRIIPFDFNKYKND